MLVMDPQPSDRVRYVFDEGDLLERIPREINRTLSDICEGYRLCYLQLQPSNVGDDGGVWTLYPWGSTPLPPPIFSSQPPHPFFLLSFYGGTLAQNSDFLPPPIFCQKTPSPPPPGPRTPCPPPRQQLLVMGTWLDLPQRWGACKLKQTPNLSLGKLHS